jgi:hypothetical protein
MEIKLTIKDDVLANIFVTALEGGSNYWADILSQDADKVINAVPNKPFAIALYEAVMLKGMKVDVYDAESGDKQGTLEREKIEKRLGNLASSDHAWALFDEILERGDATSSDICFQYMVMNQLVFG